MTITEIEAIEHLEFEETFPCEVLNVTCPNEAEWAFHVNCCEQSSEPELFCTHHKEIVDFKNHVYVVTCAHCDRPVSVEDCIWTRL